LGAPHAADPHHRHVDQRSRLRTSTVIQPGQITSDGCTCWSPQRCSTRSRSRCSRPASSTFPLSSPACGTRPRRCFALVAFGEEHLTKVRLLGLAVGFAGVAVLSGALRWTGISCRRRGPDDRIAISSGRRPARRPAAGAPAPVADTDTDTDTDQNIGCSR
jgi:hypothetical protein